MTEVEQYVERIRAGIEEGRWDDMLLAAKQLHAYQTGRIPAYDTWPGVNGTELPGESWASRIDREELERVLLTAAAEDGSHDSAPEPTDDEPRCPSCGEPWRLLLAGTVGHCGDERGNDCPVTPLPTY